MINSDQIEATILDKNAVQQIDLVLENYYETGKTKEAGQAIVDSQMQPTQVRGLENLIVSTTRFSEIINYIKNQMGKKNREWNKVVQLTVGENKVGQILLDQLAEIETAANQIIIEYHNDPAIKLEIKLRLARGWARQVVTHYLYGEQIKDQNSNQDEANNKPPQNQIKKESNNNKQGQKQEQKRHNKIKGGRK